MLYCPDITLLLLENCMAQITERVCGLENNGEEVPEFSTNRDREHLLSRLFLWLTVNTQVVTNIPMDPVKLFRHALQVYYSKSKGGADNASKFRPTINQPDSVAK